MIKKFFKKNKGISLMDIGISVTLFALFAGIVGELYYQIAFNNLKVRYEGIAVYNAVRLSEYVDLMEYDDVVSMTEAQLKLMKYSQQELSNLGINSSEDQMVLDCPQELIESNDFNIEMDVESYEHPEEVSSEDVVKMVTITINYEIMGKQYEYSVDKLKFKENLNS